MRWYFENFNESHFVASLMTLALIGLVAVVVHSTGIFSTAEQKRVDAFNECIYHPSPTLEINEAQIITACKELVKEKQ